MTEVKNTKINPYTTLFGAEPVALVRRDAEYSEIIEEFESEIPTHQVYMITGVRGYGKTVLMTSIAKYFLRQKDWFVINMSPDLELLETFAAELDAIKELHKAFRLAELSISISGLTIMANNREPITNEKVAITKMLEVIKKKKKKVLITLDETVNNDSVRKFASVFQILLREEYPVYLLMTGLHENIRSLQNEKTLTFLYRAPRVELKPLNLRKAAESYQNTLNVSAETAIEMAKITKGYPFAFQVLGYLAWREGCRLEDIMPKYYSRLSNSVYEKIYSELSTKDRIVARGIASTKQGEVEEIKKVLNMTQNEWSPYRKRLIDKGILISPRRGYVSFLLPLFDQFLLDEDYNEDYFFSRMESHEPDTD